MKRHKWSADNIAFGSGGVLELCSHFANADDFFFLHVKPKFAQFSAAYLRHVPWAPELFFFSRSAGCLGVAGIRP